MKETLEKLFKKSIEYSDKAYTTEQIKTKWIANPPISKVEIKKVEKRLGIKLPPDYIEMTTIANGFPTYPNSIEPAFQKLEEIDFYRNYQWNVIDTWKEIGGLDDDVADLERAIMIAGFEDEQQFLIIPPADRQGRWKYWKFAMWIPGKEEYQDLKSYLDSVIEFLTVQIQEKNSSRL